MTTLSIMFGLLQLCPMMLFWMTPTAVVVSAFMIPTVTMNPNLKTTTRSMRLHMIDRTIASLIDNEYYRQHHREEYDRQWMEQHKSQMLVIDVNTNMKNNDRTNSDTDDDDTENRRQVIRDQKLARTNPQQYCADRCIATGYCDVYEDFFDFTPSQVVEFCTDCVLASNDGEHDECMIPDAFYDHMLMVPTTSTFTYDPNNKNNNPWKP